MSPNQLFGNTKYPSYSYNTLPFLGGDIVGNLLKLLAALGSNGVVGLVAIAVILYLFNRK